MSHACNNFLLSKSLTFPRFLKKSGLKQLSVTIFTCGHVSVFCFAHVLGAYFFFAKQKNNVAVRWLHHMLLVDLDGLSASIQVYLDI